MAFLVSISSLYLALAVACGAFGAHGLRHSLSATDLAIWDKAVLYQMIHSLAALILAICQNSVLEPRRVRLIVSLLLLSTLIFSGSLYLLVLLQLRWLGAITPIGGAGFIVAWLITALSAKTRCLNSAAQSVEGKTE
ncbi:MAG: DUF423 domain-containing protein [Pseudomonadota bacterium]|jgi:uncharacterized membrane protein YgdD (TMEM256/DUF423 family)